MASARDQAPHSDLLNFSSSKSRNVLLTLGVSLRGLHRSTATLAIQRSRVITATAIGKLGCPKAFDRANVVALAETVAA